MLFSLLKCSYLVPENKCLFGGVFSTLYTYMAAIMSGFKDGDQVIVPVRLEFTGFVFTVLSMLTALLSRNKMIIQAKNRKGPTAIQR